MKKYYVEHRATLKRTTAPKLIPAEDRYKYHGFTSMYLYSEETKKIIDTNKNMSNLHNQHIYSDTLFVDFDDQPEAADKMIADMKPYNFTAYHSGGRSIHLHVDIELMQGTAVAHNQCRWMKEHYPLADHSIYKPVGIYRLPGTYHVKYPGCRKEVIAENITDKKLSIDLSGMVPVELPSYLYDNEPTDLDKWMDDLLSYPSYPGGQRNKANSIIYVAKKIGKTKEAVIDLLMLWNRTNCKPPLKDHEILNNIERKF